MEYGPELLKGNIHTLILAVLETGPLHGYGISKEIAARSQEALAFGEGTIYPALKALERQKSVEGSWEHPVAGPARKVYSITEAGKLELARRRDLWNSFVNSIDRVIAGSPNVQPA